MEMATRRGEGPEGELCLLKFTKVLITHMVLKLTADLKRPPTESLEVQLILR